MTLKQAKIFKKSDNSSELIITQKTSTPVVTPLFTNPIDIRIRKTNNTDTIIRIAINSNYQKNYFYKV